MAIVNIFGLIATFAFLAWLILSIIIAVYKKHFNKKMVYHGFSWVILLILIYLDFGKFFDWYID